MTTAGVNKTLMTQMFHSDFKQHIKAIDMLSGVRTAADASECSSRHTASRHIARHTGYACVQCVRHVCLCVLCNVCNVSSGSYCIYNSPLGNYPLV